MGRTKNRPKTDANLLLFDTQLLPNDTGMLPIDTQMLPLATLFSLRLPGHPVRRRVNDP